MKPPSDSNIGTALEPLQKHAYSNILEILQPKKREKRKFSDKQILYFSYICTKHWLWHLLEPLRRGGSNEYSQSMFLTK